MDFGCKKANCENTSTFGKFVKIQAHLVDFLLALIHSITQYKPGKGLSLCDYTVDFQNTSLWSLKLKILFYTYPIAKI